ncbi:hypothetical protein [Parafrigoribacterium soli]|uniref:hypothetical protein n=1 Tax=Parafrigoribacterium soli TaxID=3144663 RepID=UPI0032EFAFDC
MTTLAEGAPGTDEPHQSMWLTSRRFELALALSGVVAAALVILNLGGPVFGLFIVTVWFLLPGWICARVAPLESPEARLFVAIITGMALAAVVSLIMAWTGLWAPQAVAVVTLLAASAFIFATPRIGHPILKRSELAAAPARDSKAHLFALIPAVVGIIAIVLWETSLMGTDVSDLGKWGLLPALPVTWYIAVALMLGLCIWMLVTRTTFPRWYMVIGVGVLIAMLYGSANLIENSPRLVWTYKHLAVTNYIDAFGHVDPSIDIYNRWPGMFTVSAFLGRIAGYRDPLSYATWAEPLFALIDAALVFGIARALTRNPKMSWTAALAFSLCNWVNQNYYSPQAFAYMLYLSMCLIVMTFLRSTPQAWISRFEKPLSRAFTRASSTKYARSKKKKNRSVPAPDPWSLSQEKLRHRLRIACIVAVLILQAIITASHQLTPYLAILGLLPLIFIGYIRPRWLGVGLVAIPLLYLLPNLDFIQSKYGLFSGFDLFANVGYTPTAAVRITDAAILGARAATVLSIITVLLAAAGWIRNLQQGNTGTTIMVAWLAVAPIMALFGQSYGGEGRLRVFLFGAPWYAIGIAWLFWSKSAHPRRLVLGLTAAFVAMSTLFVTVYFQPEADYAVPSSEVKAAQWLDKHISPNDGAVQIVGNFPLVVGPHYSYFNSWASGTPLLSSPIGDKPSKITGKTIAKYLNQIDVPHLYLIFSDAQTAYARNHELLSAAQMDRIESSVSDSSAFLRIFDNSAVRVYELRRP